MSSIITAESRYKNVDVCINGLQQKNIKVRDHLERDEILNGYYGYKKFVAWHIKHGERQAIMTDGLSENIMCLANPDLYRVVKFSKNSEFQDCIDFIALKGGYTVEGKSTTKITQDCTSFSQKNSSMYMMFLTANLHNDWIELYKIDYDLISDIVVCESKNETVADQQARGIRPRFSVLDRIIRPMGLEPDVSNYIYKL